MGHNFHIPVLGLAFSIDTPIKVAKYGISSVVSIVDDELIERMREYYCRINNIEYLAINHKQSDARANRITAYLNLIKTLVDQQIQKIRDSDFAINSDLYRYFNLLPDTSSLKTLFRRYLNEDNKGEKEKLALLLKSNVIPGQIDVNIMSKVDKPNVDHYGNALPANFSDASAALRGYANSDLCSSLIISAGLNPKLFSYIAEFSDFFPNEQGILYKKIVLKVSDFRSAYIQAKILVKKGIWVSEFRIESGLNCGGHAFATEGLLLGPILEEFKEKRVSLVKELLAIYQDALQNRSLTMIHEPKLRITVQGGIGTNEEQQFLLEHYGVDATGWGSPFLLVPEATTVDEDTLESLAIAKEEDFSLSEASPLGVSFNNFRRSTAEIKRLERIKKDRPGSPCTKKYLISNTEFTTDSVCTASRVYQNLKLKELKTLELSAEDYEQQKENLFAKTCLCEGLAVSAYIKYGILKKKEREAVAICPGPNTAYFNKTYSLSEMVDHIYGRHNLLVNVNRPHLFIKELQLYTEYLIRYLNLHKNNLTAQKDKYIHNFKTQLIRAVEYYSNLETLTKKFKATEKTTFIRQLETVGLQLKNL